MMPLSKLHYEHFYPFFTSPSVRRRATALRSRAIYRFEFKSRTTQRFSPVKSRLAAFEIVLKLRLKIFERLRRLWKYFVTSFLNHLQSALTHEAIR